jgi:hypothetical protein
MTWPTIAGILIVVGICAYFAIEFGWGGGDPNDKDHNRPSGGLW